MTLSLLTEMQADLINVEARGSMNAETPWRSPPSSSSMHLGFARHTPRATPNSGIRMKKKAAVSAPSPKKTRSAVDKLGVMLGGLKIKPRTLGVGIRAMDILKLRPLAKIPAFGSSTPYAPLRSPVMGRSFSEQMNSPPTVTRLQRVRRSRSLTLLRVHQTALNSSSAMSIRSNNSPVAWEEGRRLRRLHEVNSTKPATADSPFDDPDSPVPNSSASNTFTDIGDYHDPQTPLEGVRTTENRFKAEQFFGMKPPAKYFI